jgi:hypothetical protein
MRDPKRALLFLQRLHGELIDIIQDSGVIFLLKNGITDWYIFVKVERPTRQDALIESLLMEDGERAQYSVNELSTHPQKAFMSSGTFEQIMDSLDDLGESQRELRAKIQLN